MKSQRPTSAIFRISEIRAHEAAEALAMAFLKEAATDFFFPPAEGGKLEKLRALFGWGVNYRMLLDIPVLGILASDDTASALAGAATLRVPNMPADPEPALELWKETLSIIGEDANARIDLYDEAQKRNLPARPHHYLVAIGVLPAFQGKGYGAQLLRAAIELAEGDPDSEGVALDTASEESRAYYERFGFEVFAEERLGEKTARFMFRPNSRFRIVPQSKETTETH